MIGFKLLIIIFKVKVTSVPLKRDDLNISY